MRNSLVQDKGAPQRIHPQANENISEAVHEWNIRTTESKWDRFKFETTVLQFSSFKVGEAQMDSLSAVVRTRVGYDRINFLPCCVKRKELVEAEFDPLKTSYKEILSSYMKFIKNEPKKVGKVHIFVMDEYQSEIAEEFKKNLKNTWDGNFVIHEDYLFHKANATKQKYFLQKSPTLFNLLKIDPSDDEFLFKSHIACRLNAYCYGLGSINKFTKELNAKGDLPKEIVNEVIMIFRTFENHGQVSDVVVSSSGSSGSLYGSKKTSAASAHQDILKDSNYH